MDQICLQNYLNNGNKCICAIFHSTLLLKHNCWASNLFSQLAALFTISCASHFWTSQKKRAIIIKALSRWLAFEGPFFGYWRIEPSMKLLATILLWRPHYLSRFFITYVCVFKRMLMMEYCWDCAVHCDFLKRNFSFFNGRCHDLLFEMVWARDFKTKRHKAGLAFYSHRILCSRATTIYNLEGDGIWSKGVAISTQGGRSTLQYNSTWTGTNTWAAETKGAASCGDGRCKEILEVI